MVIPGPLPYQPSPQHPFNPHPQRHTFLRFPLVQSALHQHAQGLRNRRRIRFVPKHLPARPQAIVEPEFNNIEHIIRDEAPVPARERRFVGVKHVLQHLEQGLERHVEVDKGVDDPRLGADAVLKLEGVAFEHGDEVGDWEHGFAKLEAVPQCAHFFRDGFPGLRAAVAALEALVMRAIEQVLPRGANVGRVTVVGGLVDEETEVKVAGLIGVVIIELRETEDLVVELCDDFWFSGGSDTLIFL